MTSQCLTSRISLQALASERRRLKELEDTHTELASSKAALEGELLQHQETLATHLHEAAAVEATFGLERLQSRAALEGEQERSKALEDSHTELSSSKAALEEAQVRENLLITRPACSRTKTPCGGCCSTRISFSLTHYTFLKQVGRPVYCNNFDD